MSAKNNRDDFSAAVKRNAAMRVGYNCSCPTCGINTVGASLGNDSKVSSIGVAAHIYAAAPGGPRYDSSMTSKERSDINNCLWLCQTHAHLIDTDEHTYTPELLKKWKEDAERVARNSLLSGEVNFFAQYTKQFEDDISTFSGFFDQLIEDGDYELVQNLLATYQDAGSDVLKALVMSYQIIYDVYCDHSRLHQDIDTFITVRSQEDINDIIGLLCSSLLAEYLTDLLPYCTDDVLKKIGETILSGQSDTLFFDAPERNIVPIGYEDIYHRLATSYICQHQRFGTLDQNGKPFLLYEKGFYWDLQAKIFRIREMEFYDSESKDLAAQVGAVIQEIVKKINKIHCIDSSYQKKIWAFLLEQSIDFGDFERMYEQCPDEIKQEVAIEFLLLSYNIIKKKWEKIDEDALLGFSSNNTLWRLVFDYLVARGEEYSILFMEDHKYLYRKDAIFIYLKLFMFRDDNQGSGPAVFLDQYKEIYQDNFLYHCMCAHIQDTDVVSEELKWLEFHVDQMHLTDMSLYIDVLYKHGKWEKMVDIAHLVLPYKIQFEIADHLIALNKYHEANEILNRLIAAGYQKRGLCYAKGYVAANLGYVSEAMENCINEYEAFHNTDVLLYLLALRYDTQRIVEDNYLDDAKKISTAEVQNVVAAHYMRLGKPDIAYFHFLRSLLLDDTLMESMNGLFISSNDCQKAEEKDVFQVKAGVICTLRSDNKIIRIALHKADVLNRIQPNHFADCIHYSIEDLCVAGWGWKQVGDMIEYNNEEYLIEKIESGLVFFSRYVVQKMIASKTVSAICAGDIKEMVERLTDLMKQTLVPVNQAIEQYYSMELRFPLSVFSGIVGKNRLESLLYLLSDESLHKYRNNPFYRKICKQDTLLLSYECVVMASYMEALKDIRSRYRVVCTEQAPAYTDEPVPKKSDSRKMKNDTIAESSQAAAV